MFIASGDRGSALVQVLIVSAVLGVSSLVYLQTKQTAERSDKKVKQDRSTEVVLFNIRSTLQSRNGCRLSMGGLNPSGAGATFRRVIDDTNNTRFKADCPNLPTPEPMANCVYGTGESRILLKSFRISQLGNGAAPHFNGANQATLTVIFEAGPAIGNWDLLTPAQRSALMQSSWGQLQYERRIQINTTIAAGVIQDCVASNDDFTPMACRSLGGNNPNNPVGSGNNNLNNSGILDVAVDLYCKQSVFSPWGVTATDTQIQGWEGSGSMNAITLNGRSQVTGILEVEGNLQADQAVMIGTAAGPATTGMMNIQNDLRVDRGIGVGTTPPASAGSMRLSGSLGVGVAANATAGRVTTSDDVAVGGDLIIAGTTVGTGNGSFRANLGVGVAAPGGTAGTTRFNHSLSVGAIAPPTGLGDMRVLRSMGVDTPPPASDGYFDVGSRISVTDMMTINDNSANPSGTEYLYVNGDIKMTQATSDADPSHVASTSWVAYKISRTLAPAGASDAAVIVADIMAATPNDRGLKEIKEKFCGTVRVRNATNNGGGYASGIWESGPETCRVDLNHTIDYNTVWSFNCHTEFGGGFYLRGMAAVIGPWPGYSAPAFGTYTCGAEL